MSWSIKSVGKRGDVKAEVLKVHMPEPIRTSILDILDEDPTYQEGCYDGATVEGYGHSGGGYGNIGKLQVELIRLAKPAT